MSIFIVVPSDTPTGPVKGAYAIANALCQRGVENVHIVFLKKGDGANQYLDSQVKRHYLLVDEKGIFFGVSKYKNLLSSSDGKKVISLSMCFSSDVVNFFVGKCATTVSSIRGNLFVNYRMDYGIIGYLLAIVHLLMCNKFDNVFVLSKAMKIQVDKFLVKKSTIQRNFIDECSLEAFRAKAKDKSCLKIGYLGSLSVRKRPYLLIDMLQELKSKGHNVFLHIVGEGQLYKKLLVCINNSGVQNYCRLHGFIKQPFEVLSDCDVFVLPSVSEGMSRAVMEALYLGIPCIVFNVDGMEELIEDGNNGIVIDDVNKLADGVIKASMLIRINEQGYKTCLLPDGFRLHNSSSDMMRAFSER